MQANKQRFLQTGSTWDDIASQKKAPCHPLVPDEECLVLKEVQPFPHRPGSEPEARRSPAPCNVWPGILSWASYDRELVVPVALSWTTTTICCPSHTEHHIHIILLSWCSGILIFNLPGQAGSWELVQPHWVGEEVEPTKNMYRSYRSLSFCQR